METDAGGGQDDNETSNYKEVLQPCGLLDLRRSKRINKGNPPDRFEGESSTAKKLETVNSKRGHCSDTSVRDIASATTSSSSTVDRLTVT